MADSQPGAPSGQPAGGANRPAIELSPAPFDPDTRGFSVEHFEFLYANNSGTNPDYVTKTPVSVREEEKATFPFTLETAFTECVKNRDMARKISTGFYRDRLILVVNTPKSASTTFRNCVAYLHAKNTGVRRVGLASYMGPNHDYDLRIEALKDFPQGGVLKRPLQPVGKNLKVIDDLGVRTIVLLRHPKDQLVAWMCQFINRDEVTRRYNPIYPEQLASLDIDLDALIEAHIEGGTVVNLLKWMVDWLRLRNRERSIVVRYEDLIEDRAAAYSGVSEFLYGRPTDDSDLAAIDQQMASYKQLKIDTQKYPRGYTGKVETWEDYMTPENSRRFDRIASRFLEIYDPEGTLREFYDLTSSEL